MLRPLAAMIALIFVPLVATAQEPVREGQQQDTLRMQRDTVQIQQDTLQYQQQDQQRQQEMQQQPPLQQDTLRQEQVERFEGRLDAEFRGPARVGEPHFGLSRENVRELQMELNRLGCDAGPIDGLVGPMTARGMSCAREQLGIESQDPNALFHALNLSFMREYREYNEQLQRQQQPTQQPPVQQPPVQQDPVEPELEPEQDLEQDPEPTPPQPQPPV